MWHDRTVSVVLMTYAEKDSIRGTIEGFFATGVVDEVLVVDNNAEPGTHEQVAKTAAREVHEPRQGYGFATRRGLAEATGDLIVLCEPDGTFMPDDIFKLLVYSDDCDVVFGTRTTRELLWQGANMGFCLKWGNWALAKVIEVLFNTSHLSDVGCTYRLLRREAVERVRHRFSVGSEHFGPELMLLCLTSGLRTVEVPVNYLPRVGLSSVTGDFGKAFRLGLRMGVLIVGFRLRTLGRKQRVDWKSATLRSTGLRYRRTTRSAHRARARAIGRRPARSRLVGLSPPSRLVRFGPVAAVVAAYGATIALLPRVDVPVGDDWAYARTVERFIHGDGFHILDATVATLVLQALWGAAVTSVVGFSYVTLRLSTVALAALGAVALYGLCRTLGASRPWSAVAAAAWLFHPLAYALSNSFMSDAGFAGLLLTATLFYVRGLCGEREVPRWVVAGSAVAAAAFLFRQQGALIPAAVVGFLAGHGPGPPRPGRAAAAGPGGGGARGHGGRLLPVAAAGARRARLPGDVRPRSWAWCGGRGRPCCWSSCWR